MNEIWMDKPWRTEDVGARIKTSKCPVGASTGKVYINVGTIINSPGNGLRFQPDDWDHDVRPRQSFVRSSCGSWAFIDERPYEIDPEPSTPSKENSTVNYVINTLKVIGNAWIAQIVNGHTQVIVWQSEPFSDQIVPATGEKALGIDLARDAAKDKLAEVEANLFA